jgi:hypothetical protein
MATIITKNSQTASAVPSAASLSVGELAVNTADGKLYTEHTGGVVKEIIPSTVANNGITTAKIANSAVTIPKIGATGTPGSGNFLRGDGVWGVAGGGVQTLTASGSITAGKGVLINSNGTVSEPTGSFATMSASNTSILNATTYPSLTPAANQGSQAAAVGSTHLLLTYAASNDPRVAAGYDVGQYGAIKLSDNTTSTASTSNRIPYTSDSFYVSPNLARLQYDPTSNKFLSFFVRQQSSSSHQLCVHVISVNSSNVITIESTTVLDSTASSTSYISTVDVAVINTGGSTWAVGYRLYSTTSSNNRVRLISISLSGSTVSFGAVWNPGVASSSSGGLAYFRDAQKIAYSYYDQVSETSKTAVFTRSGTALTLQATQTLTVSFGQAEYYVVGSKFASDPAYNNSIGDMVIRGFSSFKLLYATISGNTVSLGETDLPFPIDGYALWEVIGNSICVFNKGNSYDPAGVIIYRQYSINPTTKKLTQTVDPVVVSQDAFTAYETWNITAYNGFIYHGFGRPNVSSRLTNGFASTSLAKDSIGISTQTVTNGQSVSVTTIGGLNTNVSGLTPGQPVYLTGTGSVTNTETPAPIGTALSATSVLVKG